MSRDIDIHYQNVVNVYNDDFLFFLKPYYEEWVMNYLNKLFAFNLFSLPIRIVDLGCGNGCFVNKFISHIQSMNNIEECIGIDPYIEWLNVAHEQSNITKTICINANDFSKMPSNEMNYSHLLMKEMIHHVDNNTLPNIFLGIYEQLNNNGRVVIITRPTETNYPFFERIHHLWKLTQTPYENVVLCMKEVGFDVIVEIATLPVTVKKEEWISFIKNKTWSVFSMCSEQELNDGLYMLQTELEDNINFNETLIFIVGHKNIIKI
jgi:2-polyprenyl-3-methyl-5-hydroxy-6-metoxy-1,4-benzoquinol methylase